MLLRERKRRSLYEQEKSRVYTQKMRGKGVHRERKRVTIAQEGKKGKSDVAGIYTESIVFHTQHHHHCCNSETCT